MGRETAEAGTVVEEGAGGSAKVVEETAPDGGNPAMEAWAELRKPENTPLRALFTMVCLEIGGFAMCIPILSFFAIKELGLTPSQLGFVMSANAATQLVGSWACGRLSDSFGRKWLLLGSFAWSAMSIGGTAFVFSFTQLLILRTLGGLSGGTTPLCQAFIMDWVKEKARPAFIGLFGFLVGIAFLCGNVLGMCLLLLGLERRTIFLIASFFALLATIYGVCTVEESLDPNKRRPLFTNAEAAKETPDTPRISTSDSEAIGAGLVCIWCTRFLHALASGVLFSTYAFLIDRVFGWSDLHFGALMATFGILYAFLQFAVYPFLGKYGKDGSAASTLLANVCGICGGLIFCVPVVLVHLLAVFLLTITGALFEPAVPVLVSIFAGEAHLGFGNGVATACRCAASIIGPFLGGVLFELGAQYMCATGSVIYVLGAIGCIGIWLSRVPSEGDLTETKPLLRSASK